MNDKDGMLFSSRVLPVYFLFVDWKGEQKTTFVCALEIETTQISDKYHHKCDHKKSCFYLYANLQSDLDTNFWYTIKLRPVSIQQYCGKFPSSLVA